MSTFGLRSERQTVGFAYVEGLSTIGSDPSLERCVMGDVGGDVDAGTTCLNSGDCVG
jgi:hypothetical protein